MPYFMGLDGGGSHLRVVILDQDLKIHGQTERGSVNPGGIGHQQAAEIIQEAMQDVLTQSGQLPVDAVGIGIAGASAAHAEPWLRETVERVLPDALIVPSSDLEIALVGAHGDRQGALLLAGTGSAAFGIGKDGKSFQIGGWGYLLGDEGSGYWLGMQALQFITQETDGLVEQASVLPDRILQFLGLESPRALIAWLYKRDRVPVKEVANLAQGVMKAADDGDAFAVELCQRAANSLIVLAHAAVRRLPPEEEKLAFVGGILESTNQVSRRVVSGLGLSGIPQSKYTPVMGAALLAKIHWVKTQHKDK